MSSVLDDTDDPVSLSPDQLVPSTRLGKQLGAYLNEAHRRPVFIMRDQKVEAVLVSLDRYRALVEEELRGEETLTIVTAMRRMLEYTSGRAPGIPIEELITRFGADQSDEDADDNSLED